jgi:CheY-like chemotaxis protein
VDKLQILHVDDEPEIRLLMAGTLQELGHVVITAGSVTEALRLAQGFRFNLCILDVRLPDGTGVELCQQLRKLQPNVPIVYYSAYAETNEQQQALAVCGDAYLKKPASMTELQKTSTGLLHHDE